MSTLGITLISTSGGESGSGGSLPAIFVLGADGSESLVNFSIHRGDVVMQRIIQRLVLRRGKPARCIVNEAFQGNGARLKSGTVSARVKRRTTH